MHLFEQLTLPLVILLFLVAATIIGVFGVKMTHVARALSVQTGVGEPLWAQCLLEQPHHYQDSPPRSRRPGCLAGNFI